MTPNELNEKKAERASLLNKAKAILSLSEAANRAPSEEEDKAINGFVDDAKKISAVIATEEAAMEARNAAAQRTAKIDEMLAPDADAAVPRITGGTKRNDLAKTTYGFNHVGEFMAAVAAAGNPASRQIDARLPDFNAAVTGMSQGEPAGGGFLVAPEFSQQIWDGMGADPFALLPMTDGYPVTGESLTFPANAETSRATTRAGGLLGYWIAEGDQITSSYPKLRDVKVEPQQVAALVKVTDKLLRNASALRQYIEKKVGEELNFQIGDAIINGNGVGKPKGIIPSAATVSVAKETNQIAATFVKRNANKMWGRLHPRSWATAVWLMNIDVMEQLDEFNTLVKNVAGSENVGGFASMIYNAEKNTLKGRPIIPCEFCATLGTTGDVILADMKGYLTGSHNQDGIDTAESIHVRFEYAESVFRFMASVDGQPWLASPLTPYKGTLTTSTFVKLDTRA